MSGEGAARVCEWDDHLSGGRRLGRTLPRASRARVQNLACRWWERLDPFWDARLLKASRGWSDGDRERWAGTFDSERGMGIGAAGGDPGLLDIAKHPSSRRRWSQVFSILHLVGTATTEQLGALCGVRPLTLHRMARAGLVEKAEFHAPGLPSPSVDVWRLVRGAAQEEFAARVVLAGDGWTHFLGLNPVKPRRVAAHVVPHQILSVELALRALEASEGWAGWIPEGGCSMTRIVPARHPARAVAPEHHGYADGCLIRLDGGRVFLEIAHRGDYQSHLEKVARWSQLIEDGPFGGCVLFVSTAEGPNNKQIISWLKRAVREACSPETQPYVLIGSWNDYSPAPNEISEDILGLRAIRWDGNDWDECHAIDVALLGGSMKILAELENLPFIPRWAAWAA